MTAGLLEPLPLWTALLTNHQVKVLYCNCRAEQAAKLRREGDLFSAKHEEASEKLRQAEAIREAAETRARELQGLHTQLELRSKQVSDANRCTLPSLTAELCLQLLHGHNTTLQELPLLTTSCSGLSFL